MRRTKNLKRNRNMTNDELRAAAERLRNLFCDLSGIIGFWGGVAQGLAKHLPSDFDLPTEIEATERLRRKFSDELFAYLGAEHPADDDDEEPVTDEWVASLDPPRYWKSGREYSWPQVSLRYACELVGVSGIGEPGFYIDGRYEPHYLKHIRTRGDVRRLFKDMGLEMTLEQQLKKTESGLRAWHQERAIFETTNMMCELMAKSPKMSRSQLAKKLDTTKGYVTQLLDGSTNMTLRTISDAFLAIGYQFHPAYSPIGDEDTLGRVLWFNGNADIPEEVQSEIVAVGYKTACKTLLEELKSLMDDTPGRDTDTASQPVAPMTGEQMQQLWQRYVDSMMDNDGDMLPSDTRSAVYSAAWKMLAYHVWPEQKDTDCPFA